MKYLIFPFILISFSIQAGGIYTWVDEFGKTNYGDTPPVSVTAEKVKVDVAPSNPGKPLPRLEPSDTGSSTADSSRPDRAQPDSEILADQAKEICKQANYDLKVVNSSRPRLRNEDGTSSRMTTEERGARRKQAKRDIEKFCT